MQQYRILLLSCWIGIIVGENTNHTTASGTVPKTKKANSGETSTQMLKFNVVEEEGLKIQEEGNNKHRSRIEASRKRWRKTLSEIKALVIDFGPSNDEENSSSGGYKDWDQWKLLSSNGGQDKLQGGLEGNTTEYGVVNTAPDNPIERKRQRFDGFATWDARLQQWADEAAAYLSNGVEEDGNYPMSNFGRPTSIVNDTRAEPSILVAEGQNTMSSSSITSRTIEAHDSRSEIVAGVKFSPRPAKEGDEILSHTDIGDKSKKLWIVTTASLPWMTGTAVNPLLRAAYLTTGRKQAGGAVTLMLPWLERVGDRDKVYGKNRTFETPEEQEQAVRDWLSNTADMKQASIDLNIAWYTARHEILENSVYSMGDITALIPEEQVDICILEEPEHLNWYRAPGESWTKKFKHVVGIVHTNYFVYAQEQPAALIRAPAMRLLCQWMCRAHCHRIIKLSGTLDSFAPEKEIVDNVHGVRKSFLDFGLKLRPILEKNQGKDNPIFGPDASPKVYFIGKMLWSKGIGSLMELLNYAEESAGLHIDFDMYGGGPDLDEAKNRSEKLGLSMTYHGPIDHAKLAPSHKIFVNPSLSEVLCTTVAEALAMGKFVVIPSHPSNDFFAQFPNCLTYANKEEFVGNLYYALTHSPEPLTRVYAYALSWEAAGERLASAGCITKDESEALKEAIATTGTEIDLPPLIEDETRRKQISTTVKRTRRLYRQFRSNLSKEIRQSYVLPKDIQLRLLKELDKRLDLDVDELLGSPKLKVKLSPAELDRQLLEFYDNLYQAPGSDVLRIIGGGANVGRQNYYLKQQALKEKQHAIRKKRDATKTLIGSPQFLEDVGTGEDQSATKWIKRTLKRNLHEQQPLNSETNDFKSKPDHNVPSIKRGPKMSLQRNRISSFKRESMGTQNLFASQLSVGAKYSTFSTRSRSSPSLLI